jgi:hypothetical protein
MIAKPLPLLGGYGAWLTRKPRTAISNPMAQAYLAAGAFLLWRDPSRSYPRAGEGGEVTPATTLISKRKKPVRAFGLSIAHEHKGQKDVRGHQNGRQAVSRCC